VVFFINNSVYQFRVAIIVNQLRIPSCWQLTFCFSVCLFLCVCLAVGLPVCLSSYLPARPCVSLSLFVRPFITMVAI